MKSFPRDQGSGHRRLLELRGQQKDSRLSATPKALEWKIYQHDVDRVQEFRKCIECFLCQDVCHVLREHDNNGRVRRPALLRARRRPRNASARRRSIARALLKNELGIGLCNITKCCTEVCPEEIHITDNAIIPLKERVVDEFYDPLTMLFRKSK